MALMRMDAGAALDAVARAQRSIGRVKAKSVRPARMGAVNWQVDYSDCGALWLPPDRAPLTCLAPDIR